jgi:hypothetical protein
MLPGWPAVPRNHDSNLMVGTTRVGSMLPTLMGFGESQRSWHHSDPTMPAWKSLGSEAGRTHRAPAVPPETWKCVQSGGLSRGISIRASSCASALGAAESHRIRIHSRARGQLKRRTVSFRPRLVICLFHSPETGPNICQSCSP